MVQILNDAFLSKPQLPHFHPGCSLTILCHQNVIDGEIAFTDDAEVGFAFLKHFFQQVGYVMPVFRMTLCDPYSRRVRANEQSPYRVTRDTVTITTSGLSS